MVARIHWRKNLQWTAGLLVVWALAGPGCGVLFADHLNRFQLAGFPLGFWFAQQGSIVIFVLLVLIYAWRLNALDKRYRDEAARETRVR